MSTDEIELELGAGSNVDEVILGFRKGGKFYELARLEPPVVATLRRP